jgi:SnoaL-like domain
MDELRGTSRRVFDAYNARHLEALRALYAPAARTHRPGWPAAGGVDEILASARGGMVAFPDLRIEPQLSAREDGRAITEVR